MTCVHRYLLDYCILIRNCRNRSVHTNNAFCIVLATQLGLLLTLVARCRITPQDGKFMFVQTDLLRQRNTLTTNFGYLDAPCAYKEIQSVVQFFKGTHEKRTGPNVSLLFLSTLHAYTNPGGIRSQD
jgi:hypothetical protein